MGGLKAVLRIAHTIKTHLISVTHEMVKADQAFEDHDPVGILRTRTTTIFHDHSKKLVRFNEKFNKFTALQTS